MVSYGPMTRALFCVRVAVALAAWTVGGCGGGGSSQGWTGPISPGDGFPTGAVSFRSSPIDLGAIQWITPLGNLNPPGHTLPTSHIYFYFANPDAGESPVAKRVPFAAPGDGTVTTLLGGLGAESKLFVRQTSTFTYTIDHLILTVPLAQGSKVTAGQVLGTTGSAYGIDLGVINETMTLPFVNPSRYGWDMLHAEAPLKFFDEPVRSQLYAKVERLGPDLDGRIDFDIAGRLVGNWFFGAGDAFPLVFTYDTYDPSQVRIAVNTGPVQGVFSVAATDPLPRDVSVASGKVLYTLRRGITGLRRPNPAILGFMLVQMIDDSRVTEEMFAPSSPPTDFTGNARTFSR